MSEETEIAGILANLASEPDPEEELDINVRASTARASSEWANHPDADFFLPPALSTDWITYLNRGPGGLRAHLKHHFGIERD
jgi:hypothetical protein